MMHEMDGSLSLMATSFQGKNRVICAFREVARVIAQKHNLCADVDSIPFVIDEEREEQAKTASDIFNIPQVWRDVSKQRTRGSRFAIVPGWIFDCAEFSATETLVFACLCLFADDKKMCFPSVAELARVSKLGNSTVRRDLSRLETKGAISRKNRYILRSRKT